MSRKTAYQKPAKADGYVVLGTTDDVTMCECCGRKDLKGTVALQWKINGEVFGEPVFFGCVCAAHAVNRPAKEIKTLAKSADDEKRDRLERARTRLHMEEMRIREAHLTAQLKIRGVPTIGDYCDKLTALAKQIGLTGAPFEVFGATGFVKPELKLEDFMETPAGAAKEQA